jgi:ribosomal protein S21
MTIKIKKQPRETNQSLIRRFSRSIQRSGILLRARKISFKEKSKSRQAKKKAALRREELKKEYEILKKMAKPE